MIKIFVPNLWDKQDGRVIGTPTLDLFVYKKRVIREKNKINRYVALLDERQYKSWPMAKHTMKDLFPLKKMKFGDIELYTPNNGVPYLDGSYPGWKEKYIIDVRSMDNILNKGETVTYNI